jgi:hypothetical protein
MSNRWQGSLTYTLSGLWSRDPAPISGFREVTFPVANDLGGERTLAETDERHRVVFNGILQAGHGLQLSSPDYGNPDVSTNLSYAPRTVQLGFRVVF